MTTLDRLTVMIWALSECPAEYIEVEGQQMRIYRSPDGKPRAVLCGRLEQLMNQIDDEEWTV